MEGLVDFEDFALDFDDYDLLESIHTHLGEPVEPIRKPKEKEGIYIVSYVISLNA